MKIEIDDADVRAFVADVQAFAEAVPEACAAQVFTRAQPVFTLVALPRSGNVKLTLVVDQHVRAAFVKLRARHEISGSSPPPPVDNDHPRF